MQNKCCDFCMNVNIAPKFQNRNMPNRCFLTTGFGRFAVNTFQGAFTSVQLMAGWWHSSVMWIQQSPLCCCICIDLYTVPLQCSHLWVRGLSFRSGSGKNGCRSHFLRCGSGSQPVATRRRACADAFSGFCCIQLSACCHSNTACVGVNTPLLSYEFVIKHGD